MSLTTDSDLQTLGTLPPLKSPTPDRTAPPLRQGSTPRRTLTVLLIDRSPLTRECLSLALADAADEVSVITAGGPEEARAVARADLVLIHAGGEAVEEEMFTRDLPTLSATLPDAPIVLLAGRHSPSDVLRALRMGVRGYLSHDVSPDDLCRALRRISAGEVFIPVDVPSEASEGPPVAAAEPGLAHPALTPRQSEVLVRIRHGKSNKVIAFELGMQESTVKVHVRNILKQLGATNRTEAVYLADLR